MIINDIIDGNTYEEDSQDIDIIKLTRDDHTKDLEVDLGVIFATRQKGSEEMNLSIAAAKATIVNANKRNLQQATDHIISIIDSSLEGLQLPNGKIETIR